MAYDVPQTNIRTNVHFIWLFNVSKLKWIAGILDQVTGPGQLFDHWHEFMMISTVVVQFNLAN